MDENPYISPRQSTDGSHRRPPSMLREAAAIMLLVFSVPVGMYFILLGLVAFVFLDTPQEVRQAAVIACAVLGLLAVAMLAGAIRMLRL